MEDKNILLIFILYAISIFIELFAQCFTAFIFFAKVLYVRIFMACTYVRFLKGKKTPVLDSSIFYCKKYFLLLSYLVYFCIRYNRNMIPEYIKEIALSICIFHLFTAFIVILQYRKNVIMPYLKKNL